MNRDLAWRLVGGLSRTHKMPCWSTGLPISACITGSKLRKVRGSICSFCYAAKGHYYRHSVQACLQRRLRALRNKRWVEAMIFLLRNEDYFRWQDSGDLQGLWHLKKIIEVCEGTPNCKHWLPTKEAAMIRGIKIPDNLIIRLSASLVGETTALYPWSSSTASGKGFHCPANSQGHQCRDCRACWDRSIPNVDYEVI